MFDHWQLLDPHHSSLLALYLATRIEGQHSSVQVNFHSAASSSYGNPPHQLQSVTTVKVKATPLPFNPTLGLTSHQTLAWAPPFLTISSLLWVLNTCYSCSLLSALCHLSEHSNEFLGRQSRLPLDRLIKTTTFYNYCLVVLKFF